MKYAKIILLSALLSGLLLAASGAGPACPRAGALPPCAGECGRFVDRNADGICDNWAVETGKTRPASGGKSLSAPLKKTPLRTAVAESEVSASPADETPAPEPGDLEIFYGKLKMFSLIPLLFSILVLVVISEILKAKSPGYISFHRHIWNWLLFLAFFACVVTGFLLFFGFFPESRNFFFRLHLWSGFVSFAAGLYHFLERLRCMPPFRKCL